jgi:hypothetical protein
MQICWHQQVNDACMGLKLTIANVICQIIQICWHQQENDSKKKQTGNLFEK